MLVHFFETKDTASGTRVPIVGRLRFRSLTDRIIPGSPDEAVRAVPFSVPLDSDGKASVTLAEGYWGVALYGDAGWGPVYVQVGAGAEADWPDLVRVDPATLAPAAADVPAWEAAVSAVEGYAQAAADSAALAAGSAEHVGETIAAEVQGWLAANPPTAGDDGREVEFGVSATHVQWRYVGDVAWADLIALSSLVGATGATPELQATATHLQWREPGGVWADLVTLESLRGPKGDPGSSAYEVAVAGGYSGSEAAWLASLKGDQGDAAPLPVITATATTGAPGTAAAASVSGAYPDLSLDLMIPEGEQGDPGPANRLAIGTVTTLPAGAPATAGITGTAPNQTLELGIPMGLTGAASDWIKVGPGDPRTPSTTAGQITGTERDGCSYRSTDGGGVGGYLWVKRGGAWVCEVGDTGPRSVPLHQIGAAAYPTMTVVVQRVNSGVTITVRETSSSPPSSGWPRVYELPTGFRAAQGAQLPLVDRAIGTPAAGILAIDSASPFSTIFVTKQAASTCFQSVTAPAAPAWPSTLPGTPA